MTKLHAPDEQPEIDVGPKGERVHLYVCGNEPATEGNMAGRSVAYAHAALDGKRHLVELAQTPQGTGFHTTQAMSAEDAANFPVGAAVTLHMRPGERGFMDYVAITHGHYEEPAPAPGPR